MKIKNNMKVHPGKQKGALAATMWATLLVLLSACGGNGNKNGEGGGVAAGGASPAGPAPAPAYGVFTVTPTMAVVNSEYPATLQGEQNIEIRPKIDGFVDKIFIDEGSVVKKGQLLFKISNPQYQQDVNNAQAAILSAKADISDAQLTVEKAKPLVEKEIISKFELESDEYKLQIKKAALAQAEANLATAKTNLGYTTIYSPVDGVVGSLPYKTGSLVSSTSTNPLTTISNIGRVYAYFSLNEKQLLDFSRKVKGATMKDKLANTPPVNLILSDGASYPEKGRIETINGLINTETGSASFRATFPNPLGMLRSGNSATVSLPGRLDTAILVPQRSSYELQGKHFVFVLTDSATVKNVEITILDQSAGQFYVVTSGLRSGDKVVYEGTGSLKEGDKITAQEMPASKVYQGLNQ